MSRFSSEVERLLQGAGWYPGREIGTDAVHAWADALESPDGFQMTEAARSLLGEFGGLHLRGRSDLNLDPLRCDGEEDRFEELLQRGIFPIGDAGGGHMVCAVDAEGLFYAWFEQMWWDGVPFIQALEYLLLRGATPAH